MRRTTSNQRNDQRYNYDRQRQGQNYDQRERREWREGQDQGTHYGGYDPYQDEDYQDRGYRTQNTNRDREYGNSYQDDNYQNQDDRYDDRDRRYEEDRNYNEYNRNRESERQFGDRREYGNENRRTGRQRNWDESYISQERGQDWRPFDDEDRNYGQFDQRHSNLGNGYGSNQRQQGQHHNQGQHYNQRDERGSHRNRQDDYGWQGQQFGNRTQRRGFGSTQSDNYSSTATDRRTERGHGYENRNRY